MNTSEQLKNEAIRKAYGKWFPEVKDYLDNNGWFDMSYCAQIHEFGPLWEDCDKRGVHIRPKELRGIGTNNGWTRIEPDGSNLPDKIIDCWCIKDRLMFYPLLWRKDLMQFQTTDASYYDWQEFTHYQRIVEPQPPIF